jgi:two-component system, chemotaxis family, response regulator Rcp1
MADPCNVLLVEDNDGDVELVERALARDCEPVRLSVAHDGLQALEYLHRRGQFADAKLPDIIFVDINMPGMDGKQFLESMKAVEAFRLIPAIMLTSSTAYQDIADCYARHANCYVVKQFDPKVNMAAIRQLVSYWTTIACLPSRNCNRE